MSVPNYSSTAKRATVNGANNHRTKILLLGLRRAGKTSIQQVLFNNLPPNQTFYLETTMRIVKHQIDTVIPLELWDCPANTTVESLGAPLSQFSTIIFVIDIRDLYNQPISKLVEFIVASYAENPNIILEVFVHKAEKLQEDDKIENFRQIHERVSDRLLDMSPEYEQMQLNFHLTSVYDHSLHEAFSRVLHKLIDSLPFLEELLNVFCANSQSPKAFLFDTRSRLYVATDASPVDSATHNLCCDYLQMLNSFGPLYKSITATPSRQRQLISGTSIPVPATPPPSSISSISSRSLRPAATPSSTSTAASASTPSSSSSNPSNSNSNARTNAYRPPPPTNGSSSLLAPIPPTPPTPTTPRASATTSPVHTNGKTAGNKDKDRDKDRGVGVGPGSGTGSTTVTPTTVTPTRPSVHGSYFPPMPTPPPSTSTSTTGRTGMVTSPPGPIHPPTTSLTVNVSPDSNGSGSGSGASGIGTGKRKDKDLFYPSASTTLSSFSFSSSSSSASAPASAMGAGHSHSHRHGHGSRHASAHGHSHSQLPTALSASSTSLSRTPVPNGHGHHITPSHSHSHSTNTPTNPSTPITTAPASQPPNPGTTTLTYHLITQHLALLALIPAHVYTERRGLVEYNVVFFREGVQEICEIEEEARGV
ncbi:GTP-binding protein gtr2 [Psilocybe cubensis]|uniref:GTP-binding protein gtr2 n=1 Tax=Psilocybe cubensis TaxID=181762 RepID=A0ACB8H244_PSICU|nr:GTP-binding protein gtr2 [Psilocybe cubensis]KAH9481309.1 GTP-binding protein gtr2 [Psilocybe cubensis]